MIVHIKFQVHTKYPYTTALYATLLKKVQTYQLFMTDTLKIIFPWFSTFVVMFGNSLLLDANHHIFPEAKTGLPTSSV